MENEIIYTEYEVMIQHICDKYLNQYKHDYQEDHTIDTAKKFMDKHYDNYRREVANTAMELMHKAGLMSEVSIRIINQNTWSIGKLFAEIMKLSSDFPKGLIP